MKHHYDERVRNYSKVMKTDILKKEVYFKCEEFTNINSLEMIEQDLNSIDV